MKNRKKSFLPLLAASWFVSSSVMAADCRDLPNWSQLKKVLTDARNAANGGLKLDMWATVVSRDGSVCAVAYSGSDEGSQWPGSRVISAQKANTANAFSLPGLALSTANLYSAVQPGGSLFGLQESNPVNIALAYQGEAKDFGTAKDPMIDGRIGGVNVFGGGLALYDKNGKIVGGLGVSGDTSCADHNIAWRARKALQLDFVPAGVSPSNDDAIIFLVDKEAPTGFKHPLCSPDAAVDLPPVSRVKK